MKARLLGSLGARFLKGQGTLDRGTRRGLEEGSDPPVDEEEIDLDLEDDLVEEVEVVLDVVLELSEMVKSLSSVLTWRAHGDDRLRLLLRMLMEEGES